MTLCICVHVGERAKDKEGFLQGVQEAPDHEGDTVQDGQGFLVCTR